MYFNNFFNYHLSSGFKAENKCNKIFRPWDNSECNQINSDKIIEDAQDSTVSTTTDDKPGDEAKCCNLLETDTCRQEKIKSGKHDDSNITAFKKPERSKHKTETRSSEMLDASTAAQFNDYNSVLESYPSYPEILHANLAHSLGLTPTDPLFLESLTQGYALEEYARVLNQEHQSKILSSRKQRPKKYKCPHCDVGFSNNGQLKGHIRIHTGERPFKCDEKDCGKTFTRNEELTRHKRIHSGLRPFPCSHCGKRFGRKDHLKKHSRTHMQHRGLYAVPVMLPFDTWNTTTTATPYPYVPMFGY